jgi:predicted Fe-Mo cluster-binding NifX family protein
LLIEEEKKMKIAVASDKNNVSPHFGHCEGFAVFEVEDKKIGVRDFLPNPGHRPGFLPLFLKEHGVEVIIAGGMGAAAQELFKANGITVIIGAGGSTQEVIRKYLEGVLESTGSVCHEHEHHDSCH